MPIKTDIWTVDAAPTKLVPSRLPSEQFLEDMIVNAPDILSDEWMLVGRQESTGMGGRIDLLAVAPDGALVLIELKRDRTPREVVAQALDYAVWIEKLRSDEIELIYKRLRPGRSLGEDFRHRFGRVLGEGDLNNSHQLIIVATELDASSERIVFYLSERDIPINVLCFQVFQAGERQLLSRSWLLDPAQTQVNAASTGESQNEPWNGEFYCSYGVSTARSWDDAIDFGFISGGGGSWYSRTLRVLAPGDRVWVNVPQQGYVGVCRVIAAAAPASTFTVMRDGVDVPVLEAVTRGSYHAEFFDDLERCEYFVGVEWLQTVPLSQAAREIGFFGNQNTICRPSTPKWRWTVERLKTFFQRFDEGDLGSGGFSKVR